MNVEYLGHACFLIENESGVKFLTDPYTGVGYEMPRGIKTDVALVSHGHFDHNYLDGIEKFSYLIADAGTYTLLGNEVEAVSSWHDPQKGALRGKNLIFKIRTDGLTVCHFGDLGEAYSEEIAQKLAGADVWMIPVGGTYTIDAKQAKEYIEKLKPLAVIPMHYRPDDGALNIAKIEAFLMEMDGYSVTACPNGVFSFTKADLQAGTTKIIYMKRRK